MKPLKKSWLAEFEAGPEDSKSEKKRTRHVRGGFHRTYNPEDLVFREDVAETEISLKLERTGHL